MILLCALFVLYPGASGEGEGVVTITWTILPRQTLSELPGITAERTVLHPFELPRPSEEFALHVRRVVLAVRSNIPWVVTARLECAEGHPVLEGVYLVFEGDTIALNCEHIPLVTGELGEHLLDLKFTILVPGEGAARGSVLERTLVFEIFPVMARD
ncbi:hypothetical protein ACVNPS_04540 [Candidatus Bipolaricaulota sp. J31]